MIDDLNIFELVGVTTTSVLAGSSGSSGPSGRRGAAPYSPWQGWAVKDVEGGSSIARRNRRILEEQKLEEGKELYEDYLKDTYGEDWDKGVAEMFGETMWEDLTEEQQKQIAEGLGAGKSSIEQSNIRRAMREEADDAVREEKRERENERREDKHEELFKGWRPPKNQTPQHGEKKEDEGGRETAAPQEEGEEEDPIADDISVQETDGAGDTTPVTQSEFNALKQLFDWHRSDGDSHYA